MEQGTLALKSDALPTALRGSAQLEQKRHDHKKDLHVIHTCSYGRYFNILFSTDKRKRFSFVILVRS